MKEKRGNLFTVDLSPAAVYLVLLFELLGWGKLLLNVSPNYCFAQGDQTVAGPVLTIPTSL